MSLDRDDLAARFAVAIAGGLSADSSVQTYDHGVVIEDAFDLADALIARLRPAPVAPVADAAPRPEWVRITGRNGCGGAITVGKVYRVMSWDSQGSPVVANDEGYDWYLCGDGAPRGDTNTGLPTWEPCAAPAPSAATSAAPSPAASPAAYVPKVGDRVMHAGPDDGRRFVVTAVDAFAVIRVDSKRSAFCVSGPWIDNAAPVYDGPATAAERAAAGLPPITPDHPQGGQGAEGDQRVAAGLDAPAFDESSERETAVDIAKDRGLDVAEEVGFVAGWLARARIAAKGGAS